MSLIFTKYPALKLLKASLDISACCAMDLSWACIVAVLYAAYMQTHLASWQAKMQIDYTPSPSLIA